MDARFVFDGSQEVIDLLIVNFRIRDPDSVFVIAVNLYSGWVDIEFMVSYGIQGAKDFS